MGKLKIFLIFILILANLYLLQRIGLARIVFLTQGRFLDFDNYYRIVRAIFLGQHPYRDYQTFTQTLGPPPVLIFYLPFGLLPLNLARWLITFLNLASVFLLNYILAKNLFKKEKLLIALFLSLLLLSSFPARFNLLMGQPNLVLAFLLTIFLFSHSPFTQGLSLALVVIIKTFFGFTYLALFKKNKKALLWFAVFLLLIIILALPIIKPSYFIDYFKARFLSITFIPTQGTSLDYYNQSIKSTMFRLGISRAYFVVYPAILVLAGIYLIFSANLKKGIILALLISPVCWQHYFVVLFPLMIITFKKCWFKPKKLFLLGLSFMLFWLEFPFLQQAPFNLLNRLLASHYFLSGLILLFLA